MDKEIKEIMLATGANEDEARFILAIESGTIDGDVVDLATELVGIDRKDKNDGNK